MLEIEIFSQKSWLARWLIGVIRKLSLLNIDFHLTRKPSNKKIYDLGLITTAQKSNLKFLEKTSVDSYQPVVLKRNKVVKDMKDIALMKNHEYCGSRKKRTQRTLGQNKPEIRKREM